MVKVKKDFVWTRYFADEISLDVDKTGKWMYFYSDYSKAEMLCDDAVNNNVVTVAKHNNKEKGVACFYLNIDDIEGHKRVLRFFLENDLIQRKNNGSLYNIAFKLDNQTRAGKYGDDFKPELKLEELLDLETEEWKV